MESVYRRLRWQDLPRLPAGRDPLTGRDGLNHAAEPAGLVQSGLVHVDDGDALAGRARLGPSVARQQAERLLALHEPGDAGLFEALGDLPEEIRFRDLQERKEFDLPLSLLPFHELDLAVVTPGRALFVL